MVHLLLGAVIFILSVWLHIIRCRISKRDVLHIRTFIFISACGLLGFILLDPEVVSFNLFPESQLWYVPLVSSSVFLYILMIPTYLIFYFSINVDSPSRLILNEVEKNGRMTFEELSAILTNDKLITPRIVDLIRSKYMTEEQGRLMLTSRARRTGQFLKCYQMISGRAMGG